MPGKICEKCKAPWKGYGAICSPCRSKPGPKWGPCTVCGSYFCGYGGVCDDCKLEQPGSKAAADAGGEGPAAAHPPLADPAGSPGVRRRATARLGQAVSAEEREVPTAAEQIMDCQACSKVIGLKPCVSSQGETYHVECFACKGCKAPLSRLHTLAPGGGRLCVACAPTCHSCRKPVIGLITKADGNCYHPDCFACHDCGKKVVGNFVNHTGRVLCQVCNQRPQEDPSKSSQRLQKELGALDERLATKLQVCCHACHEPVRDNAMLARGEHYHPACFKCFACGDQLDGSYSVLNYKDVCLPCASKAADSSAPSCSKCGSAIAGKYRATADGPACAACSPGLRCAGCWQPIEGEYSQVGENSYHPECFTCRSCSGSLSGGYYSTEGGYLCGGCAQTKQAELPTEAVGTCAKCSSALSGEYVDAGNGDRFHGSCFTCDGCSQALEAFALEEGQGKRRYLCEACA